MLRPSRFKFNRLSSLLLAGALLYSFTAAPAFAKSNDHVSFGDDITIAPGDTAADIVCAFCSVSIHGDVTGDVAVFLGNVSLDSGHNISHDVALFGGDLNVGDDAHVGGDVAIMAGDLNLAPTASVRGDRAVFSGTLWLLIPFAPFLLLLGIIWLVVYLVRRNRYRYPVYPHGRAL